MPEPEADPGSWGHPLPPTSQLGSANSQRVGAGHEAEVRSIVPAGGHISIAGPRGVDASRNQASQSNGRS